MASYGKHLGLCFQIIDDILDYTSSAKTLGKNTGDDLADGKMTLPLIHAYEHATASQKVVLSTAIEQADDTKFQVICDIITQTQSIEYCQQKAQAMANECYQALQMVPCSEYKTALEQLIATCLQRTY